MMLILPVGVVRRPRRTPWVTWLLIAVNCFLFARINLQGRHDVLLAYALVPDRWHDLKTVFTSLFLHGDPLHLLGNMLFLYIVGASVEDRLGHVTYLMFYLLAGVAGAAAHVGYAMVFAPAMSTVPTLGASGAISGVMGAFLVYFPGLQVKFILWLVIFIRAFTLPAWGALGYWRATQLLMARNQMDGIGPQEEMMVAVFAHLGGFAFGFAFAFFARLFGPKPEERPA